MRREVRKGMVNYDVNESLSVFVVMELFVMTVLLTYVLITQFQWNSFASLVISGAISLVVALSKLYMGLGYVFSIGWGYLGYKLFYFFTTWTGGGNGVAITIGVVGFIFAFLVTVGARMGGKEYFDDIE